MLVSAATIFASPLQDQAKMGAGMQISGNNSTVLVFYEEVWGSIIQLAWYTATGIPASGNAIYEELYL